ncbi:MAG: copper chaperone PCu(A)C [Pigmentiphaga sp.]|uniref:copper chaperone PCu(A)C n=1 Tax=Pigmentiphaga sp. TaxID=1977564 RepID=UPI0029BD1752|nr:copper chaperone PCu(A)C [Pigmentiphaga sp.]MDX3905256.1 copper chaperone PCu(A)C [Pigmentiphaga sp.]
MQFRAIALPFLFSFFATGLAHAQDYSVGNLHISQPWARATVAGQPSGGGFLKLTNDGGDDKLVAIRSEVSATAELHTMQMDGDIMRMRPVDGIALPAGQTVELKPGGYHIMFMQLKAPLKEGSRFPATLVFQKAGEIRVDFKVEPPGAGPRGHGHHH